MRISLCEGPPYGIARTAPQMFDQAAGFVQKSGKTIREFVYSDIEYGPSYGKEITEGTIYDAEDHGEPPNGIMSKPKTITQPVRHHSQNGGRSEPTGHGDAGRAGGEQTEAIGSF